MRREEARSTKDLLAEAGFRMKSADTPEKLACLKTMTPLELARLSKDGRIIYSYADPDTCHCLYVGSPMSMPSTSASL